jgi:hypothetical protein
MLTEALNKGLTGDRLYVAMKSLMRKWGKGTDEEKEATREKIQALKTDDNADEFEKYLGDIADENGNNKGFIKAMKRKINHGDNLAMWMLRHLVSKAQQSS